MDSGLLEMLNVVILKSMESPQSPHGVCGNMWESVKYSSNCIQTHFPKRLKIKEENIYICPTAYAIIPNHR